MGILPKPAEAPGSKKTSKPRTMESALGDLKPLKTTGTVGWTTFRDSTITSPTFDPLKGKLTKKKGVSASLDDSDEDSDADEPKILVKAEVEEQDDKKADTPPASHEDGKLGAELEEGVRKIKVNISIHSMQDMELIYSAQTCTLH
jgi:hypothetical protein